MWAKAICLSCNVKCMLFLSFLHVPMSVPLAILYALPCRFSTASCPSPSPLTKDKDAERGWSRWKGGWNVEVEGWNGWVERGWNEGWSVEKVAKNWYQIKGYVMMSLYCICSDHLRAPLLGIFPFPFHFSAIFSLLCPSPRFYMSISGTFIPIPKKM